MYATTTQFKEWLGSQVSSSAPGAYQQLMDRLTAVSGGDGVATELLTQASAEIDSRLAVRGVTTPVETDDESASAKLRQLTLDIATWRGMASHPKIKEIPERVQLAYDEALVWLADFVAGDAMLPGDAGAVESVSRLAVGGGDRVMTNTARAYL
jgi:phage gp36-like protein